ncbi:MAG: IS1 family transposase [SAR324 cluster bacterium]|nr:IS1 family transposase [SAR324 cluster bacterium]
MRKLPTSKRAQILHLLCEGTSLRSASRLADCSINTVTKLLVDAGTACQQYQDQHLRNLSCKRIQLDEIWSFCYAKAKNVPENKRGQIGFGDVWTWTALCADSKLMISWLCGARDADYANAFVDDLAGRLNERIQLTSDGHNAYLYAVDAAFGGKVDYSMLVKLYGKAPEAERRYSPPVCVGAEKHPIIGNPDPKHISTSYIERSNLTVRMMNRRFTRLTNAFSKKMANHEHSFSLFAMHYNFCRIHKTLKVTPAMEAGVTDHVWSLEEMVEMIEAMELKSAKRGPYKKRISN